MIKLTVTESEEDTAFWEIFDEFKDFVTNKTNCTVMQHKQLEADDLIAGWVQAHPNDNHVLLLAPTVTLHNLLVLQYVSTTALVM